MFHLIRSSFPNEQIAENSPPTSEANNSEIDVYKIQQAHIKLMPYGEM